MRHDRTHCISHGMHQWQIGNHFAATETRQWREASRRYAYGRSRTGPIARYRRAIRSTASHSILRSRHDVNEALPTASSLVISVFLSDITSSQISPSPRGLGPGFCRPLPHLPNGHSRPIFCSLVALRHGVARRRRQLAHWRPPMQRREEARGSWLKLSGQPLALPYELRSRRRVADQSAADWITGERIPRCGIDHVMRGAGSVLLVER
jgi:hypothetical protein